MTGASLTAGFTAMDRALAKAGLSLADMDRIEFMEAFAVTIAKFMRDRTPDPVRVNVSGGHLAKGHPMGATGAILTSTLLDALDACEGRYGLVVATGAMGIGAAMAMLTAGAVTTADGSRLPMAMDSICLHGDTPGSLWAAGLQPGDPVEAILGRHETLPDLHGGAALLDLLGARRLRCGQRRRAREDAEPHRRPHGAEPREDRGC